MKKLNEFEKNILNELIELENESDQEFAHREADDLLIELLRKLGYNEICDSYEKVGKWYA